MWLLSNFLVMSQFSIVNSIYIMKKGVDGFFSPINSSCNIDNHQWRIKKKLILSFLSWRKKRITHFF